MSNFNSLPDDDVGVTDNCDLIGLMVFCALRSLSASIGVILAFIQGLLGAKATFLYSIFPVLHGLKRSLNSIPRSWLGLVKSNSGKASDCNQGTT